MHKRVIAALVVFVLAVAALAYFAWDRSGTTNLARAVDTAPPGAERLSWTDWAGVRRELGSSVDRDSNQAELTAFLDDAYEADLSSRSALLESAGRLQQLYGFSPASLDWELFSQGVDGAVIAMALPDDADFDDLARRLEDLGYPSPETDDGVWAGGPDLVSRLDAALTPELAYVVLDADDHLVLASDQQDFLESAVRSLSREDDQVDGLADVVDAMDEPLSAAVFAGDYACAALAMAQADPDDQAEAAELMAAAGTVDPYLSLAIGVRAGGDVRVAMLFANEGQARTNADSRAILASGPAVGQGGDFSERFTLRSARADGPMMMLELQPVEGQYVIGDLSSGPVLFATC